LSIGTINALFRDICKYDLMAAGHFLYGTASVRQAMLVDDLDIIRMQLDYPIMITGRSGGADLSDDELVRLSASLLGLFRTRENQWLQYQNGVIDERTWRTYQTAIPAVLTTEFMRSWWRNRSLRGEFDEGFVVVVDKLLEEHPLGSATSLREGMGFDPL